MAIAIADQWIWSRLYNTPYQVVLGPSAAPTITDLSGNVPKLLTKAAVQYAGYDLLSPRGVNDFDKDGNPLNRLYGDYMDAQRTMKDIADKILALDVSGVTA